MTTINERFGRNRFTALFAIGVFAVIGTATVLMSLAASSFVAFEPENATVSGAAVLCTDTAASGGKYIQFGSACAGAAPAPSPTPTTPPPTTATASPCLQRTNVKAVSGAFTSQYNATPANGSTIDARKGTWTMKDGWLATPGGGTDVCWVGGSLKLTVNDQVSTSTYTASPTNAWSVIWHHNGGFTTKNGNSNWIFDGVAVSHVGDAFNLSNGSVNFEIRNSHLSDIRDDCVQNDYYNGGTVHDNFFDGCYVGFSARASGTVPDGHLNTWNISSNLVWIKPMWSVYKGDSPGNGEIIKWDTANLDKTPKLVFKNNIIRVGKTPFQVGTNKGDFYIPPGTDFSNNVLIWDGAGAPPANLASWFNAAHNSRIGTMADWDAAVSQWKANHPEVL